jgi:UDP-2,4-diacetamido-2,4,6-trideoxy-beta-L-altropyranose hydrolase
MNIAFRVDASEKIATGHFMRCLTLADALQQRGARIRFFSRRLPEHLRSMLKLKQHEFAPIGGTERTDTVDDLPHAGWLDRSQAQDAADTLRAMSDLSWDWVVVDHYALDARWESLLRKSAAKIAVIDDIADRRHDCDLLLDQNFHPDAGARYLGKVPAHCRMLLGPAYALLREEFRSIREQVKPRSEAVKRILIFFGGVDAGNLTAQAIEAIAALGIADLQVDAVVGASHPQTQQIASQCLRHGFTCHVQTSRMAQMIAAADLSVGAGGSVTWERCCLGLPTLALCVAENQREQIAAAAYAGFLYAPESSDDCGLVIQRHARALIENRFLRQLISRAGMQAVDGRGVWRVVEHMVCSDIEIRAARCDDARHLFEWRNDPSVRSASRSTEPFDWDRHQSWLASVLSSPNRLLLIGQRKGTPVGVVRFDVQGSEAEISIYLVPGPHPPGDGRSLLHSAERWLTAQRPVVNQIRAEVSAGNTRSERLFLRAGYHAECSRYTKRVGGQ